MLSLFHRLCSKEFISYSGLWNIILWNIKGLFELKRILLIFFFPFHRIMLIKSFRDSFWNLFICLYTSGQSVKKKTTQYEYNELIQNSHVVSWDHRIYRMNEFEIWSSNAIYMSSSRNHSKKRYLLEKESNKKHIILVVIVDFVCFFLSFIESESVFFKYSQLIIFSSVSEFVIFRK